MRHRPYVACGAKHTSQLVLHRSVLTPVLQQPNEINSGTQLSLQNHASECLVVGRLPVWCRN